MMNGRRYCRKIFTMWPGKRELNAPGPAHSKTQKKWELITVLFVATLCSRVIQNLKVVAAGRVFMNPSASKVSSIWKTIHMEWKEQRLSADVAIRISVMYLMMVPHQ